MVFVPMESCCFCHQQADFESLTNKPDIKQAKMEPISPCPHLATWSSMPWGCPFCYSTLRVSQGLCPKILQDGNPRTWRKLIFPWIWPGYRMVKPWNFQVNPMIYHKTNGIVPGLPGMSMAGELGDKISRDWRKNLEMGETPESTVCTIF